jgi:uncharacterized phage protein gp47/JayE
MTTGLTPQGYVAPTQADEVADLNTQIRANVSAALDLDPDQPLGQLIGIFAEKYAELAELGATVYNSLNPLAAEGALLVNAAALAGIKPQVATYGTVTATLTFSGACTVNAGAIVAVVGQPANTWVLLSTVVIGGAGTAPGNFRASAVGQFVATAGTLTVINTPVVNWTLVSNAADAVPGLNADTDTTLRVKQQTEQALLGSGDVDALRALLLALTGMVQAFVFENNLPLTDANGIPPNAVHAVIWDGPGLSVPNATIAQTLWNNKPSGVLCFGGTSVAVLDSALATHYVAFDRATQLRTYVTCTVTAAPGVVIGATQRSAVRNALLAYALAQFTLGVSILDLPFRAAAIVPNTTIDVPTFAFDFVASPVNTANLAVTTMQIATLALGDISVNGTFA